MGVMEVLIKKQKGDVIATLLFVGIVFKLSLVPEDYS